MDEREQLERALAVLKDFVGTLAAQAGESEAYVERLWEGIRQSGGLLQELAYYHDKGQFLCKYEVAGYIPDVYAGRHPCMAGGSFQAVYGQAGRDEPVQTGQALAGLF